MDGPGLCSLDAVYDVHLVQLSMQFWLQVGLVVAALFLCAVASTAETALTSLSRVKLKNLVEEGDQRARRIEQLLAQPATFLSTLLVVNTVAMIVATSVATFLALQFSTSLGEILTTVCLSVFVLIFCEIVPRTVAVQKPLLWACNLVGLLDFAVFFLRPLTLLVNSSTSTFVRMFGGQVKRHGPFMTEEDLRLLVTVGEEEGVLEEEETEMIHSIFEFADTAVREVMVPRIDMVTLSSESTVTQAVDVALQGGLSRIPVYEDAVGVDEIVGILYTKDMLRQLREGHDMLPIQNLVRVAYFVPETKKLDDLLRELRLSHTHMAIVVDEYGSVVGLVTIEDLMEEIVGDIQDEYDHEELLYEQVDDTSYIVNAKLSIYDFNELMNTRLADTDYDTLGGFVYAQLDKIPGVGDTISYDDLTFTVLATRGRRIVKIRVERYHADAQVDKQADVLLLPSPDQRDTQALVHHDPPYEYKEA